MKTELKELITQYHPAVLWFDGQWMKGWTDEDGKRLYRYLRALDPKLIINNRIKGAGDYETPEQYIPPNGLPGRDWETCMTMNDTWGYKSFDNDFKSIPTLLHNLIDIASKGGNYLLNVGPEPTGIIPPEEVDRLAAMGKWLKANGSSIYATSASPFKKLPFSGRCTVKGKTLYVNVFTWPSEGVMLKGLQTTVKSAKVVATGEKLTVTTAPDGTVSISQPSSLDPISTAVALQLTGDPVVVELESLLQPMQDGTLRLNASESVLDGKTIQIEGDGDDANVGFWSDMGDKVEWKVSIPADKGGKFTVAMDYACDPNTPDSTFSIEVDSQQTGVTGTVEKTEGWHDFHNIKLNGELSLPAGKHIIKLVPLTKPHEDVMNLRRLVLTPAS
jgi:alpha-L-fucosidase